jgi:DNA-binding protein HU-beta
LEYKILHARQFLDSRFNSLQNNDVTHFFIDRDISLRQEENVITMKKEETMSRDELITKIAKDAEITKKAAGAALNAFIEGVMGALEKGDKVSLVGFGTYSVTKRAKRKGINPQTKKTITIPARKVPVFRAGKKLKDAVK